MANIYLRLPLYLAEFYRGRNPKFQLGRDDIFCFPPQSEEWNIIRNGCAIMEPLKQRDRHCYCQQQWKQLMDGFTIDGKRLMKPFLNGRRPDIFEMAGLEGQPRPKKSDKYDYLCIKLPSQVWVGERLVNINAGYSLTKSAHIELMAKMRYDWLRMFVSYFVNYCFSMFWSKGIEEVNQQDAMGQFCVNYNLSIDGDDMEFMRKQMLREVYEWIEPGYSQLDPETKDYATWLAAGEKATLLNIKDVMQKFLTAKRGRPVRKKELLM